jgi:tetratricopeptide (TPR) repeat protein
MKKSILLIGLSILIIGTLELKAQINIPQPSPKAKVETTVGLTDVAISYFRPSVKDRQIFGDGNDYLQPYGILWRAGANNGTVLNLNTEAVIAGNKVDAGEYLIFMVPGENEWEFKLYSDLAIGGNVGNYDESKEVMSVILEVENLDDVVETLTYQISDISADNKSANIHFEWENVSLKVPFEVTYDDKVMAQIEQYTKVSPRNLITAANYYYTNDRDLKQALTWIDAYLAEGNNSAQFWNLHLKAQILAKMGDKKEAKKVAEKSIELAKENSSGDFGYIKRNQDLIDSL